MVGINPAVDIELQRQTRNHTNSQKKNASETKEGFIVNTFVKDNPDGLGDLYTSMVISDDAKMPKRLKEDKKSPVSVLLPTALIGTGVMATIGLVSALISHSAKINLHIDEAKKLEHLTRNVSITDEITQGFYQMVQCPNKKTIMAGTGVIALSAMAFMGKMVVEGIKDVWVKKKEADIQKNLQENLINVETQSFSGKMQIIRSMLAEKARDFSEYLTNDNKMPVSFKNFLKKTSQTSFSGEKTEKTNKKEHEALKYFAFGAATIAAIVGFGFASIKNLSKGRECLEKYIKSKHNDIEEIVKKSTEATMEKDKKALQELFKSIDSDEHFIKNSLAKLQWTDNSAKDKFISDTIHYARKSTVKADHAIAGDGTPRVAFNSYVTNYIAFFYNYLLDMDNPQFKVLFWGVTSLTALAYGGKAAGTAVKDVEVKKMNAQTELDLQKRLVSTELRNFKSKKDAAIEPLCEEFDNQVQNGKPKSELKTMAENILSEIKNGPPFVYS